MAHIRHIAILSDDPGKLAHFWHDVFGFEIVGITDWGEAWVTDGYLHIALLVRREDRPKGINHWGVSIEPEEKDEVYKKMTALGLTPEMAGTIVIDGVEIDRAFVEAKAKDIDGNSFDLVTGVPPFAASRPVEKSAR